MQIRQSIHDGWIRNIDLVHRMVINMCFMYYTLKREFKPLFCCGRMREGCRMGNAEVVDGLIKDGTEYS
jgi:hypothetical protein